MFKQYYFRWKEAWMLSSVIDYDTMPDEYDSLTEYLTDWTGDAIRSEICYTDREGNVLNTRKTAELPNVLSREACLMKTLTQASRLLPEAAICLMICRARVTF